MIRHSLDYLLYYTTRASGYGNQFRVINQSIDNVTRSPRYNGRYIISSLIIARNNTQSGRSRGTRYTIHMTSAMGRWK